MTTECAWCTPTLDPNASHGICRACAGEVEARTWQPRYRREIDQILSAQNLGADPRIGQIRADFEHSVTAALSPEESAAKADATRTAWAKSWSDSGTGKPLKNRAVRPGSIPGSLRSRAVSPAGSNPARSTFSPPPPAPVVPRNRVDPVRVLCYAGCAVLLAALAVNVVRWLL